MGQSLGQGQGYVCRWGVIATAVCLWATLQITAAPQNHHSARSTPATTSLPDIVFVQTPTLRSGGLSQRFPQGSAIVLLKNGWTNRMPIHLTNSFFAAADPQIDFQGNRILFSAQKTKDERWQIWEMDLDGSNKRQITTCAQDCLRGVYLPADEIAFTVEESRGENRESYIAVTESDGSQQRRITFGPAEFELETVLRDGRIVASAPWPLNGQGETAGSRTLYTLRPDGTALESFRCEHTEAAIQSDANELEDGGLIFIRQAHNGSPWGGELMQIQRGSAAATPLGAGQAIYASARPIDAKRLIAAKANGRSSSSQPQFDLYLVSTKTGAPEERIFTDPQLSSIQALPVAAHEAPKHFWTTLNPESNTGFFISLNSSLSADAPGGHFTWPIWQVRVLTWNPVDRRERNLGEAPVESDGSFYVSVPANAPVRFVLLDAKGQTIHEEHGWVWTRPGEQRGCTGCHGDKNVAPENHWPLTLKRFDTPTPLGDTKHAPATATAK